MPEVEVFYMIKELQADLQNDPSLDEIASYWANEVCLFNPPVQYIRK